MKYLQQNRFNVPLFFAIAFTLLLSVACVPITPVPKSSPSPTPSLPGTAWVLLSYGSTDAPQTILEGTEITFELTEDGEIGGSAGCNTYGGNYQTEDDKLTFSGISFTQMFCDEPEGLFDQELAYLSALGTVDGYIIEGGELILIYASGDSQLTFTAMPTTLPETNPLAGTNWILSSYGDPNEPQALLAETQISASFGADGRLTGSAGCNNYTSTYQLNDDTINVSPAALTRKLCSGPSGVMEQENVYGSAIAAAESYQLTAGRLEISYDSGNGLLIFAPEGSVVPLKSSNTAPKSTTSITNRLWTLSSLGMLDAPQSPIEGTEITAQFAEDGRLSGLAGCNNYFASYEIDNDLLTISGAGATRKACSAPEGVMEQEQGYLALLTTAESYQVVDGQLQIVYEDGAGLLIFE